MTKIVALCGGPGVGKSTVATGVFSALKQRKISCEYVSEYAKEITWEGTHKLLENQIHVFAEQFRRQFRLLNKVDYVVTDSPLLLSSIYFDHYYNSIGYPIFSKEYAQLLRNFFDESFLEFNNITFKINRVKDYDPNGRNQTLDEAIVLDNLIDKKLKELNVPYTIMQSTDKENIENIVRILMGEEDLPRWTTLSKSKSDYAWAGDAWVAKPWTRATEENWPGDVAELYKQYNLKERP